MANGIEELEIEQLQKVHGEATMLVALLSRYTGERPRNLEVFFLSYERIIENGGKRHIPAIVI